MADRICKHCGEVITDKKQRLYCNVDCRLAYHDEHNSKPAAKRSAQGIKWSKDEDEERFYDCICPQCGILHRFKMYWSGANITPRIRCKECKQKIKNTEFSDQKVYAMQ